MLVAVPNLAVGADALAVSRVIGAVRTHARRGAALLDVHVDADHDRTVLTLAGAPEALVELLDGVFRAAVAHAPLGATRGVHPRVGLLDVTPFVTEPGGEPAATAAATRFAARLADRHGVPVFRYGQGVVGDRARLVTYRRRGPDLAAALATDLPPDHGPPRLHPRAGAACVGVRPPMVAYNIDIAGPLEAAHTVARALRSARSGLPGVEALAFRLPRQGRTQLSFNLRAPFEAGPARVYAAAQAVGPDHGLRVGAAEVVGLPPRATIPDPVAAGLPARTPTLEDRLATVEPTDTASDPWHDWSR